MHILNIEDSLSKKKKKYRRLNDFDNENENILLCAKYVGRLTICF